MFEACGGQRVSGENKSKANKKKNKSLLCEVLTHCLQVVLHDVPRGLHHLEHHVVLDVLHKVEHALSESERSSKPVKTKHEVDWLAVCLNVAPGGGDTDHLGERREY